jgi:FkbM family methyltransferase
VFQKLGIRSLAIYNIDFITWVRQYGPKVGASIFKALLKPKNGYFVLKTTFFKNPLYLRDNYSDAAIFKQVFYDRQYFLERLSGIKADYIIDAGANIGLASVYFSQQFPAAKIVALEPEKENFKLLEKNTINYPNVICSDEGLWYREENIQISNPESLAASFIVEAKTDATVKGITVNTLLERYQWPYIDILKMDIEGAEKEIFSVPAEWLKKIKLLIIELHDNYKPDCTKTFFKALEPYTYEALFYHENIFIIFK